MNNFPRVILITCILTTLFACTEDNSKTAEAEFMDGVWQLTAWNVSEALDMNNDGVASNNLLNEISCSNNEILEFDSSGIALFNNTFNPSLEIISQNSLLESLRANIICNPGVIGAATTYSKNGNIITLGSETAIISGDQITIQRKDKLKVFDADMSKIVVTKDVDAVYTKL
ncbi:hypothetical protein V8G61_04060 [Gaetbulibacter sp. M240]|uniref:hypothetical protein n=1 Tax=Gaetbulibacter sp. M240 TaxID=3126511 RepID=UPI00374F9B29